MSKFIIRRAKAEDGAALCAIYAPYITDTTITRLCELAVE